MVKTLKKAGFCEPTPRCSGWRQFESTCPRIPGKRLKLERGRRSSTCNDTATCHMTQHDLSDVYKMIRRGRLQRDPLKVLSRFDGAFHWQCVSSPEQGKSTIFVKSPPAEASIFRQSVTNMTIGKTVKYEYDKEISIYWNVQVFRITN